MSQPALEFRRRADIQIIRGVAVLGVMLTHFGDLIPGGFFGVDVFFVVSGFVITLSLIRLRTREAKVSSVLKKFWLARFWRLLPALTLVIVATLIAALFILGPSDFREQVEMSLWSLFFAANIGVVVQANPSYFDIAAKDNWFLHLWSLGVEEQFYVVFPFLVLFVLGASVTALASRRALVIVLSLAVVSLGFALINDLESWLMVGDGLSGNALVGSVLGYYSPLTRSWQFLLGVAAALLSLKAVTQANALWTFVGGVGVLGSMFLLGGSDLLPGPASLIPTVGAFLLLLFPLGENISEGKILRPLVWLGDRSYSAYLWHWPLWLIVGGHTENTWWKVLAAMGLTLLLSELTYRYVERPLKRPAHATAVSRASRVKTARSRTRTIFPWLIVPSVALVGIVPLVIDELLEDFDVIPDPPSFTQIDDANNCRVTSCLDEDFSILIMGDSHAGVIAQSLEEEFKELGLSAKSFITGGCLYLLSERIISANPDCQNDAQQTRELFAAQAPELVVLHGYSVGYFSTIFSGRDEGINLIDVDTGLAIDPQGAERAYEVALADTIDFLVERGITVLLVSDVPDFPLPPEEALRDNRPATQWEYLISPFLAFEFGQTITRDQYLQRSGALREAELRLASSRGSVFFVDSWDYVCEPQQCSQVNAKGEFIFSDWDHLSPYGAQLLTRGIMDSVSSHGSMATLGTRD